MIDRIHRPAILLGCLLHFPGIALAGGIPPGQLVAKVVCEVNPDQSYAVYVPSGYDPARLWPVLFCFDPRASGIRPVQLFMAAAEKHGCIVIGSNNSRNGPMDENRAAIAAILHDASTRWLLDRHRVYAAGLSGGARVACLVGLTGVARGVIACSAGFPTTGATTPERVTFDFFGTAGTDDFNRKEMEQVDRDLASRNTAHCLRIFSGRHEWPPAALAEEAIAWLEAQSRHAAIRDRYDAFIRTSLAERLAATKTMSPAETYLEYRAMAADFSGLAEVSDLAKQAGQLARQPGIDDSVRAREKRRATMIEDWLRLARDQREPETHALIAKWREQAGALEDTGERRQTRRAIEGAGVRSAGTALSLLANGGQVKPAVAWAGLAVALCPEQPGLAFNLACLRALDCDHPAALTALRQAVQIGFKDAGAVRREPAFSPLHGDPNFEAILAEMKN